MIKPLLNFVMVFASAVASGGTSGIASQGRTPELAVSAQRDAKVPGQDLNARRQLADSYYRLGDYANAARELQFDLQATEKSGRLPGEDLLLFLRQCYGKLRDDNATAWVLEKLVTYHPRKEYWAELLDRTQKRPDFGERLGLDVQRLRLLTGTLGDASAFIAMADAAVRAGLTAEASSVIEQGFAKGVLGNGAQVARHGQLRQQLAQLAAVQRRDIEQLGVEAAASKAKDGIEIFNLGLTHVSHGNFDKGLALMEQGIRKGGFSKKPQDARLRLGIAYLIAGQKVKAVSVFKQVSGQHGAADLARIWSIYAQHADKSGV